MLSTALSLRLMPGHRECGVAEWLLSIERLLWKPNEDKLEIYLKIDCTISLDIQEFVSIDKIFTSKQNA